MVVSVCHERAFLDHFSASLVGGLDRQPDHPSRSSPLPGEVQSAQSTSGSHEPADQKIAAAIGVVTPIARSRRPDVASRRCAGAVGGVAALHQARPNVVARTARYRRANDDSSFPRASGVGGGWRSPSSGTSAGSGRVPGGIIDAAHDAASARPRRPSPVAADVAATPRRSPGAEVGGPAIFDRLARTTA
jgi:hypothetical protein